MSESNVMVLTHTNQESPAIGSLRVLDGGHRIIAVTWRAGSRSGREDVVCLSPLIDTLKFYAPIRKNSEIFETVHIVDDGYAIAWGNDSIDMSAASVERLAEEAMTGKDFYDFMKRNALTHQAAAAALGRSKRQIENYVQYEMLPRMVVLACIGYETRKLHATCVTETKSLLVSSLPSIWGYTESTGNPLQVCVHYSGTLNWAGRGWRLPTSPEAIELKQNNHG
jgi:hypothetical protein